jgi:F-type H+-transporting ATPase subunit delta
MSDSSSASGSRPDLSDSSSASGSRPDLSDSSSAVSDPVVEGYAQAIVAVAEAEGALERVEDELFRFGRAVQVNPELRDLLIDPSIDASAKLGIVTDLLGDRAHPQTLSAVAFIVQSGRARQLTQIAEVVVALAAQTRAQAVAEVRSAVELTEDQRRRLAQALSRIAGRDIDLKVIVDPTLVGGVVARIGDTVIDGSVAHRLAEVRSQLMGV